MQIARNAKTDKLISENLEDSSLFVSSLSLLEGIPGLALALLAHEQGRPLPMNELFLLNL